ncbi:MAG: CopG family transcriptional regulator [Trueperaceae bacterium]|nr:CopG family transcriptional regulator [Trueperaceae bacterium]
MEKMTLHLSDELFRAVAEAAERQNRSREDVIRDALAAYLQSPSPNLPRSIGAASDVKVNARERKV